MTVSRLREIPGIGVDSMGDRADRLGDPDMLRLENLDTDIRPPQAALDTTVEAVGLDSANSYLPVPGQLGAARGSRRPRRRGERGAVRPATECVITAGGLNGVFNALLATVEPGDEVVLLDPIYAGLVNRVRLAGGVPRFVRCTPTTRGWVGRPRGVGGGRQPAYRRGFDDVAGHADRRRARTRPLGSPRRRPGRHMMRG